ncbi:uncharacterized protein LOC107037061 [Diachasma alloeum]|uniref:uncharacterized protein LOC107037061 n=1 Tax=Diachasma alloeum TaxID=454923 RepID=UPI00073835CB|nr:uncharacterized protein LOC107037061 [Diachasma alloeum]
MARLLAAGLIALMTVSVRSEGIFDCLREDDSLECGRRTTDAALDKIELEVTGRKSPISFSRIVEESAGLFVDGVQAIFGAEDSDSEGQVDTGNRESRHKLFLKKKKKKLTKLFKKMIPFLMLIKAKISLMLQMISTHFQFKFFIIGVLSIIINGVRLFLDLKKNHNPHKVIYYTNAEHQHHYEQDDEAYWRRSAENVDYNPQERAYGAYAPKH